MVGNHWKSPNIHLKLVAFGVKSKYITHKVQEPIECFGVMVLFVRWEIHSNLRKQWSPPQTIGRFEQKTLKKTCWFAALSRSHPLFCCKRRRWFFPKKQPTKTGPKIPKSPHPTTTLSNSDVRPRNGVPPFKKFPACKATPKRCLCKGKCHRRQVGDGWDGEQALVVGKWYLFCCD